MYFCFPKLKLAMSVNKVQINSFSFFDQTTKIQITKFVIYLSCQLDIWVFLILGFKFRIKRVDLYTVLMKEYDLDHMKLNKPLNTNHATFKLTRISHHTYYTSFVWLLFFVQCYCTQALSTLMVYSSHYLVQFSCSYIKDFG